MAGRLVLTASAGVADDAVARAVSALEGAAGASSAPLRLGTDAVEIAFEGDLATVRDAARAALDGAPLDVNATARRDGAPALLIADMDSTIIAVECIDEIADLAGVGAEVSDVTERAMRGEVDFEGALRARVALLKGAPEGLLARAYEERVRLNPGAEALVASFGAAGADTALISGGFTYFTTRVAAAAGFATHQANRLVISGGVLTGEVEAPILGREAKLEALDRLVAARGAPREAAVAVGDGANDLAMLRAAGLGVAYRAKPAVRAEADAALDWSDLTAVAHLAGIAVAKIS